MADDLIRRASEGATSDLVRRLRKKRERFHDLSGVYWSEDMLCQEAADRIESDARRIAELKELLKEARDDLLDAAVNEALERAADCCIPHCDDDSLDRQAKLECALAIRAMKKGEPK